MTHVAMPATMHCTSRSLLGNMLSTNVHRTTTLPPAFLLPAFSSATQISTFSTSASCPARKDGNPARGISAIKRTGLNKRTKLSVKLENLPKPVLDPRQRTQVETDPEHGLWGFFHSNRKALMTPDDYGAHGRAWTVPELRLKSWSDLHSLWWMCCKEMNKINTSEAERKRIDAGYGEFEANKRADEVYNTQKAIKHVLTERWYAWENARYASMEDDEVDWSRMQEDGNTSVYVPRNEQTQEAYPYYPSSGEASTATNMPPPNVSETTYKPEVRA